MLMDVHFVKRFVVIIQAIGFVILLILFIGQSKNNNEYEVSMEQMQTSIDGMKYNGKSWSIDSESGDAAEGEEYVLWGPGIPLERGTYTLVLNYQTSSIQKGVVEVDEGVIKTADFFLISSNKNELSYDFKLTTDAQGFKFRIKEYFGGNFILNGITIIRNAHDIRCMLFLWLVITACVDAVIFIPIVRDNSKIIMTILFIAFVGSLPLFPVGMMTGSDITYHLVRIEGIADGLRNGVFPVKMYSIFNDGYGYPVGIFYGDVLLYFPALLRLIGFTSMTSYKIYIFIINILTVSIAYYCAKKMFGEVNKALLFAVVYTFSTYRLVCVYARAAIGECSAACFYPIIMLAMWNIYSQDVKEKSYKKNAITLAVGVACLIYTHILSTEMFVLALALLAIALFKKTFRKETIAVYCLAIALCFAICAAFIIPFAEYYFGVDTVIKHVFAQSYIQSIGCFVSDYFAVFKSITGGDYVTRRGLLTPGFVLMLGLLIGISLIVLKKADSRIKIMTWGGLISLFVASSLFPWDLIAEVPFVGSFLVSVQFPYRYLEIAVCFLSILLVLTVDKAGEIGVINAQKLYKILAITSFMFTLLFSSFYQDEAYITSILRSYDTADLSRYTRSGKFGMGLGVEYLLNGTDVNFDALDYSVYGENSTSIILSEEGLSLSIYVDADDNATVEVPRFAYPHFVARNKSGDKLDTETGFNNRIKILFPKAYKGEVYIDFEEPWYWRVGEMVTLIAIAGILMRKVLEHKKRLFSKEDMKAIISN